VNAVLPEPEAAAAVDAQRPDGEAAGVLKNAEAAGDCVEVSLGAHA
jgi:DNA repair protein SbcD/Mre11